MRVPCIVVALIACLLGPAALAATVVVEVVQYPAWLERGGETVPLVPGIELQGRDRLRTGASARAKLRFSDGSTVKLGENARFEIERVQEAGFLRATLRVAEGAFRYATEALRQSAKRSVTIHARNVTIGIRGTDLWGKSTDERSLVCLIEGAIAVGAEGHPTVTLDQPLDFYELKRDAAPSVQKVDAKQLAEWALETEPGKDGPVGIVGGTWRVTAAVLASRDAALDLRRRLRALGYPAQLGGATAGAFSVEVAGLGGEEEARSLMQNLRSVPGISSPFVGR